MRKRIMSALIATIIVALSAIAPVYAEHEKRSGASILESLYNSEKEALIADPDELALQNELIELYQIIDTDALVKSGEKGSLPVYSEAYGGCYISNGKLVVCSTKGSAAEKDVSPLLCSQTVSHSYNELLSCNEMLLAKQQKLLNDIDMLNEDEQAVLSSIVGFGIDEELNAIVVDVIKITDNYENDFFSLFGFEDEPIVFQEVGAHTQEAATYKPGRAIYVITERNGSSVSYSRISIGYKAFYRLTSYDEYGFTSCGHGVKDSVDGNVYSNSSLTNIIGTRRRYRFSGSTDVSFIKLSSGNSVTMQTHYSNDQGSTSNGDIISGSYMTTVPKGSTVYKVGSTTYKTSATVKSTNYSTTLDGVSFTNLTKTSAFVDAGDSGGLVYMYFNGKYNSAGIVTAMGGWWIFSFSLYTKAVEVADQMSIYPYSDY